MKQCDNGYFVTPLTQASALCKSLHFSAANQRKKGGNNDIDAWITHYLPFPRMSCEKFVPVLFVVLPAFLVLYPHHLHPYHLYPHHQEFHYLSQVAVSVGTSRVQMAVL